MYFCGFPNLIVIMCAIIYRNVKEKLELSLKIGSKRDIMIVVILVGPQRARIDMIYGHVFYIS